MSINDLLRFAPFVRSAEMDIEAPTWPDVVIYGADKLGHVRQAGTNSIAVLGSISRAFAFCGQNVKPDVQDSLT